MTTRIRSDEQKARDKISKTKWREKNRLYISEKGKESYQENKDKRLLYGKDYRERHVEKVTARGVEYRACNREWISAKNKERYRADSSYHRGYYIAQKEKYPGRAAEYSCLWRKNNPEKHCVSSNLRRARKLMANPGWSNKFFIEEIYSLAQLRTKVFGFVWHVDHIVPLQSKVVCGLHWERNLQVIPALKNYSKGNRTWPDMPEREA